jgi:heme-degrading monooxygenase HmoA
MHMLLIDSRLKPGKKEEFLEAWKSQILPLLKKQNGFVDEFLFFEDGADAGVGLSFWDSPEEAERYLHNVLVKASSYVERLIEGGLTVRSCGCDETVFQNFNRRKAA